MSPIHPKLILLVVDDPGEFREALQKLLLEEKHDVTAVTTLTAAREVLATRPIDAVFVDEELSDGHGSDLLEDPVRPLTTEVVVVMRHGSVHDAVDAMRRGASDYLTKPIDPTLLQATLARLTRIRALRRDVDDLREALRASGRLGPVIGRSRAMQAVFDLIQRVAPTNASVLIQGESGTGKEVVAQAIHELSLRKQAPLVAVNCGAIPEHLLESEMFGHEKGSFTGADRLHRGYFELADGGTLLLDEITEMPMQLQVKLLRVLETGLVQRVGGSGPIPVSVRVLAATNREPEAAIQAGKLRRDLYFRLAVFPIRLPPLGERKGDVELLAQHFLDQLNRIHGTDRYWEAGALDLLARRTWRGNARELRNAVQRAYILTDETLRASDAVAGMERVGSTQDVGGALSLRIGASIAEAERVLIQATLEHVDGNKPTAARMLGISLKTLYSRLNVYEAAAGAGQAAELPPPSAKSHARSA